MTRRLIGWQHNRQLISWDVIKLSSINDYYNREIVDQHLSPLDSIYSFLWIFTTSILMYYVDMCTQFITFSVA